jgi:hypothetical protein
MTTQTKSLYDRLGGLDMTNALTESWVARVGGDAESAPAPGTNTTKQGRNHG